MEASRVIPGVVELCGDFFTTYNVSRGPVLGRGMSGEVVLITSPTDSSTKRAVKILSLLTADGGIRNTKLFTREVMLLQRLSHPHVIKHTFSARCPEYVVICTEYCSNGTLASKLGHITEELLSKFFLQMTCAVRYINGMGIVHSDIKPANIFIDAKNDAVLGDFGLAVSFPPGSSMIRSNGMRGTIHFIAPEKINRTQVDPYKIDMYSLGVVLWCMLSRRESISRTVYTCLDDIHLLSIIHEPYRHCLVSTLQVDPDKRLSAAVLLKNLQNVGFYKSLIECLYQNCVFSISQVVRTMSTNCYSGNVLCV